MSDDAVPGLPARARAPAESPRLPARHQPGRLAGHRALSGPALSEPFEEASTPTKSSSTTRPRRAWRERLRDRGARRRAGAGLPRPRGRLRATSAKCTHEGCTVRYKADESIIWCACHNGRFDLDGRVLSGPPRAPWSPSRASGSLRAGSWFRGRRPEPWLVRRNLRATPRRPRHAVAGARSGAGFDERFASTSWSPSRATSRCRSGSTRCSGTSWAG